LYCLVAASAQPAHGDESASPDICRLIGTLYWHTDYAAAYQHAVRERRQLVIFFRDPAEQNAAAHYESRVLADPRLLEPLKEVIRAVVSTEATFPDAKSGAPVRLLDHPAFRHQERRHGLAVLDLADPESPHHGKVVSSHPFSSGRHYTVHSTRTILELPEGSITQRALIYALRMHPDAPNGVFAQASRYLCAQANSHSHLMAQIRQVGHHNWGTRSQNAMAALGGGVGVGEVAAMAHGSNLIDAARNCVNAWRNSPGHWAIISTRAVFCGYDLVKAPDGSWYAAGIVAYPH
jgi:hypothetical protein